jgi:hypothetical protein
MVAEEIQPIVKINEAFYLLNEIRVSKIANDMSALKNSPDALLQVGDKLSGFQEIWQNSKLGFSIDQEVFNSRKIDFEKMRTTMRRILDDGEFLKSFDSMKFSVREYKLYCDKKGFVTYSEKADNLLRFIEFEINIVENEEKRLRTQVDNVNLYYQNFMITKATRIAYVSLGIASLAFLLTIVQTLFQLHII